MAAILSTTTEVARVIWAQERAAQCERLWIAVLWRIVLDLEPSWDNPPESVEQSRLWFEAKRGPWKEWREELCALAGIDVWQLLDAYHAGKFNDAANSSIGKRRWLTRRANAAAEGRSVLSRSPNGRKAARWNPDHPLAQVIGPKVNREKAPRELPAYLRRESAPPTR